MTETRAESPGRSTPLLILIAVQTIFAAFFLTDVVKDGVQAGWPILTDREFLLETGATFGLIGAIGFELRMLLDLMRRKAHLERQLSMAAGAFHDIVTEQFRAWSLTPSEQDVALLTLKGLPIPEIAQVRGCAEGTVKSHLGGIYRKAGVNGRGAFLSLFIEELMTLQPSPAEGA